MKFKETVCFDDVLLVPKGSDIKSRSEINLSSNIGDLQFDLPIISSPMDTVTEANMAITIEKLGGLGVLHRYNTVEDQVDMCQQSGKVKSAAIGVSDDFMKRAAALYEAGVKILCIDVAHGHHVLVERALQDLKDKFGDSMYFIAGNVATPEAFRDLSDWGADAIRVGIGGGSICSTRIQTGHGVPTFQSVIDCAAVDVEAKLIADGGIKTAGDIVKCLAAGADFVMLGSVLAGTEQSPGQVFTSAEGKRYKVYRGMASPEAQIAWRGNARSLEGVSTTVPYKGCVVDILQKLERNIKSGLSYSGARNIRELQAKSTFIKQSSASMVESGTHILNGR